MAKTSAHIWRLLVDQDFSEGDELTLPSDEHHYVFNVLRLLEGSEVEVGNGRGAVARGVLTQSSKKQSTVKITSVKNQEALSRKVHLFLGMPKPATLEEVVSSVAELGIHTLSVFRSDKCPSKAPFKREKLERAALEALRVSKQAFATKVRLFESLQDCLAETPALPFLLCDETPNYSEEGTAHNHLLARLKELGDECPEIGIFVGPEASFSDSERALLVEKANAHPVSLGKSILRVPTACVSACSIALAYFETYPNRATSP